MTVDFFTNVPLFYDYSGGKRCAPPMSRLWTKIYHTAKPGSIVIDKDS